MNLERIAEIEAAAEVTLAALGDHSKTSLNAAVALELCRLARLGLRVEGAPTRTLREWLHYDDLHLVGKRVAMVVLDQA